jgi:hypothetical protein
MKDNVLTLLTSQCVPSDEIDTDAAQKALADATARVPVGDDEIDQRLEEQQDARAKLEAAGR